MPEIVNGVRMYDRWTGSSSGNRENPAHCIEAISEGYHERQCSRPRGYGPDEKYCKQHAAILERRRKHREELEQRRRWRDG